MTIGNLVDAIAPRERWLFKLIASDVQYQALGAMAPAVLKGYARGLTEKDGFGAFIEGELFFQCEADQFTIVVGNATPRRFDRVIMNGRSFSIIEWHGRPENQPIFWKARMRGDAQ